ncbi:MAG: tRNA (adenosine(37)-N6)-threonylcarbamoyltransferase complex ATPase subunit type 1 TsaE, partial [Kiritimatiellae bacterium]|nr:tRNA (adenosine(37)-N6)-threonylcarbamoyltransferase complex ATPase subunit type 1 TsaE [Kiritimatiellia bacterium]
MQPVESNPIPYRFYAAAETRAWAAAWAVGLPPGAVVALHGELGAGKTCFVQGMAAGLGIDGPVTSPTFTLLHEYGEPVRLIHMDAYRLSGPEEAEDLGFEEWLERGAILAVEWPERISPLLPSHTLHIYLELGEDVEERVLRIT